MGAAVEYLPKSVETVEAGLRQLLLDASQVKQISDIEPPLGGSQLEDQASVLVKELNQSAIETQASAILETAARRLFYSILSTTHVDQPEAIKIWNLLDVLLILCELRQTGRAIIWYLIEELVESQTADRCRIIFDYLDSRRDRLTEREFQVIHLIILRTCNELLRRLSKAEDATFCGRVFFFLFQIFPLGENSSVNLRGEFHTDNVTVYEDAQQPSSEAAASKAPEAMVVDEVDSTQQAISKPSTKPQDKDTPTAGTDETDAVARFYSVFWNLQKDFSMPTRLIENEDYFATFKSGLENTITKFSQTPVLKTKSSTDEARGTKRKRGQDEVSEYQGNYNPKYLTSRDLFDLELSDLSFQRHILVQALILLDFLLSLSQQAQNKFDSGEIAKANQSVNYGYVLPDEKREWAQTTRAKIATYLQQGPDGNFYYRMVNTVLARDKNWIWWKIQRCPAIVKDAIPESEYVASKASARQATKDRRMRNKPMGAMDLTFLSDADSAKGLESLKDPTRFSTPSIDQLIDDLTREELDLDFATDEEKKSIQDKIDGISWRIVRAATRTSLLKLGGEQGKKTLVQLFGPQRSEEQVDLEPQPVVEGKTPEVQVT